MVTTDLSTNLKGFIEKKQIEPAFIKTLSSIFSPSTVQTNASMEVYLGAFENKVFHDESSETGVRLINQLKRMKMEDRFNCVRDALSMATKTQPPTREPKNAATASSGSSQHSSVCSRPPKKPSNGNGSHDSLSRSTPTKKTFAGSPEFRHAFTFMLSLLKKEERDRLTGLFGGELGSGKDALEKIIQRLEHLQKLLNGINEFDDDNGQCSQQTVCHGFEKYDWDRRFYDFIVAELSVCGADSASI